MISTTFQIITIPPYAVVPKALPGSIFFVLQASGPFEISFDGSPYMQMQSGIQLDNRPTAWQSLVFQNLSAVAVTIYFYVGNCAITYSPTTVNVLASDAPTYSVGSGVLNTKTTQSFSGQDAANGNAQRKQIVITNLDTNGNILVVLDAAGVVFTQVLAGQTWTMESNAGFQIVNTAGVNYIVGETFYEL